MIDVLKTDCCALDFCNIDRVFLELRQNNCESILDPECFSFDRDALLKMLVMLNRMGNFSTRVDSFPFDGIDHIVWTFVAESHSCKGRKVEMNNIWYAIPCMILVCGNQSGGA